MKEVFLIAGGPSLKKEDRHDLYEALEGKEIWTMNMMHKNFFYLPNRLIFVDGDFFSTHKVELYSLYTRGVQLHTRYFGMRLNWLNEHEYKEIMLAGMLAVWLAIDEGYEKIYMLGYDHKGIPLYETAYAPKVWERFKDYNIINVNDNSSIECFQKITYEELMNLF